MIYVITLFSSLAHKHPTSTINFILRNVSSILLHTLYRGNVVTVTSAAMNFVPALFLSQVLFFPHQYQTQYVKVT